MSKRQSEDVEDLGLLPDLRRMRLDEDGSEMERGKSEPAAAQQHSGQWEAVGELHDS